MFFSSFDFFSFQGRKGLRREKEGEWEDRERKGREMLHGASPVFVGWAGILSINGI